MLLNYGDWGTDTKAAVTPAIPMLKLARKVQDWSFIEIARISCTKR